MKGKINSLKSKFRKNMKELYDIFRKPGEDAIEEEEEQQQSESEQEEEQVESSESDREEIGSPLHKKVDSARAKIRDTLERWSDNSGDMIKSFLNKFESASQKVELTVHNAFNFKSS